MQALQSAGARFAGAADLPWRVSPEIPAGYLFARYRRGIEPIEQIFQRTLTMVLWVFAARSRRSRGRVKKPQPEK